MARSPCFFFFRGLGDSTCYPSGRGPSPMCTGPGRFPPGLRKDKPNLPPGKKLGLAVRRLPPCRIFVPSGNACWIPSFGSDAHLVLVPSKQLALPLPLSPLERLVDWPATSALVNQHPLSNERSFGIGSNHAARNARPGIRLQCVDMK